MRNIETKEDLPLCQDCNKFKDCKLLDRTKIKCTALSRTYFPYDCPFYTEIEHPVDIEIEEEDFSKAATIEFMEWLLEQKLGVRAVGVLSTGEKYDLTKTYIKRVINDLRKLEDYKHAERMRNNG